MVVICRTGSSIKEIKKRKDITQAQLGLLTGINQPNILKYEKGQRSPSLEVLERIAKTLRVDIKELLWDI